MSPSDNGSSQPKKPGDPEGFSMEKRLLLAFALMGVVLFATQYFFKPPVPSRPTPAQQTAKEPSKVPEPAVAAVAPPPPAATTPPATALPQVAAAKDETYTIETDVYRVVFANRGAAVKSWQLKHYKDSNGKPLELVNLAAVQKVYYPFTFVFKDEKPSIDLNQALFIGKLAPDSLGIDFEYSNGKTAAKKAFRFDRASYRSEVDSEASEAGKPIPHLLAWRGGFGDETVVASAASQHSLYFETKLITHDAKAAKDGPVTNSGQFSFAGLEDAFFACVVLPKGHVELQTIADNVATEKDPQKEELHVGAAFGGEAVNHLPLFVGPKDLDLLRKVDPKLESIVDFGTWFGLLAKPLFLGLNYVNDKYVHNYGWSIVLVTVIINFLLLPLKLSSMKSMKKMQTLQPQIAAINERYKNVSLKDPKKAQQNEEVMALYKKHGVNPMGGCMPMALQVPFFIAFYTVLTVAIEMRGAQWLWITDLSQPETLALHVLPLLMIGTQFWLQSMTPNTAADPSQQKMMKFMPLMMGFFFYSAKAGLVLYWLTGNLVGVAQQWFFNRITPAPATAEITAPKKKGPRN
jgi:YidC/Oxa1 family membrane protein insertase